MRRSDSRWSAIVPLLALLAFDRAAAQRADLVYQDRGKYHEGIRDGLSNGPKLDLIAALVDHVDSQEKSGLAFPPSFKALFYLPSSEEPSLTIREIRPRYFYWLGDLLPTEWQERKSNEFVWPTGTVIRFLNWDADGALSLHDLGAIIRLGYKSPLPSELVAPVALYHSRPPDGADGYRFVFLPSLEMRLESQVFPDAGASAVDVQPTATVPAKTPYPITYKAKQWQDGWYRLVVSGYAVSNNARVNAVVRFYHYGRLGR